MKTIDFDNFVKIFPSVQRQQVVQHELQRFSMQGVVGLIIHHSSFGIRHSDQQAAPPGVGCVKPAKDFKLSIVVHPAEVLGGDEAA